MPPSNVTKKPKDAPPAAAAAVPVDRPTHNFRFTAQNETLEDVLKSQTVGLVHLSDFKKRRAELLEQKEREAANANQSAPGSAGGSRAGSVGSDGANKIRNVKPPAPKKRKKTATSRGLLSFDDGDGDDDSSIPSVTPSPRPTSARPSRGNTPLAAASATSTPPPEKASDKNGDDKETPPAVATAPKRKFNTNLPAPTVLTKASLRKEAEMREALRKEFNKLQDQIRNEEISIPFVFYDGTNVPGGECKMKKGEAVWLFLERARRTRGLWHRVSVDDLMFVRGEIIIPHHYEFYYFIVNGTVGPHGKLFDYPSALTLKDGKIDTGAAKDKDGKNIERPPDDPTVTKVVDRRWYERNKHIFPASMWETFDPNKDYANMIRRDKCENSFFFS
ncbi:hypothetical protein ABW21_db0200193 [Orbilia brochopaga]|nr:hypothetical protein ABW21_db0200193 [Drechslerella brochopaga]